MTKSITTYLRKCETTCFKNLYNKTYILAIFLIASFSVIVLIFLIKEEYAAEFLHGTSINTFS